MTPPPTTAQWPSSSATATRACATRSSCRTPVWCAALAASPAARLPAWAAPEDLQSSGLLGLVRAVDRYDPSRGVRFEAFAAAHVISRMLDELGRLTCTALRWWTRPGDPRLVPLDTPANGQRDRALRSW